MEHLLKTLKEANRPHMFKGHPQLMVIGYTKARKKDGKRRALRFSGRFWVLGVPQDIDKLTFFKNRIETIKLDGLRSIEGFALLSNKTGLWDDWQILMYCENSDPLTFYHNTPTNK